MSTTPKTVHMPLMDLLAEGAHPKTIQVRRGHASVQITLDRYGHLFPELDRQVAEGLDRTFAPPYGSSKVAWPMAPVTQPGHK